MALEVASQMLCMHSLSMCTTLVILRAARRCMTGDLSNVGSYVQCCILFKVHCQVLQNRSVFSLPLSCWKLSVTVCIMFHLLTTHTICLARRQ